MTLRAEKIKRIERFNAARLRAERQHEFEFMLDQVKRSGEAARERKGLTSKYSKKALRRYLKWLQQGRTVHSELDPAIKPWFAEAPAFIDSELAKAEPWSIEPSIPKRDAAIAKAAVAGAYHLLVWSGHKPGKTQGGPWEKLAQHLAGLAGDKEAKVFNHIRDFDRKQPMFKRRRVKKGYPNPRLGIIISRNSAKPGTL